MKYPLFLLARCVFVTQTAVYTTKKPCLIAREWLPRSCNQWTQKKYEHRTLGYLACTPTQSQRPTKVIALFHKSEAETKSDFLRARLLDESFKAITEDKSAVAYYRKLSNIIAQMHKIGILCNQTVKAINSYHSVKAAQVMLQRLEQYSQQIISLEQ